MTDRTGGRKYLNNCIITHTTANKYAAYITAYYTHLLAKKHFSGCTNHVVYISIIRVFMFLINKVILNINGLHVNKIVSTTDITQNTCFLRCTYDASLTLFWFYVCHSLFVTAGLIYILNERIGKTPIQQSRTQISTGPTVALTNWILDSRQLLPNTSKSQFAHSKYFQNVGNS